MWKRLSDPSILCVWRGPVGRGLTLFAIAMLLAAAPADLSAIRQPDDIPNYAGDESAARRGYEHAQRAFGLQSEETLLAAEGLLRALRRNGRAWSVECRSLAATTVAAAENLYGQGSPRVAPSLVSLGDVLAAQAEFDTAISTLERAVRLSTPSFQMPVVAAEALERLGAARLMAGQAEAAIAPLEDSLALADSSSGEDSVAPMRVLGLLAAAAQSSGQYARASPFVRRAQELRQATSPDHPDGVEVLNIVAQQAWFEGRMNESRRASEDAVDLARRTLRPAHPARLEAQRNLSATMSDLGDLEAARSLKAELLALAEAEFGPTHQETANYLNGLGIAERRLGNYPVARRHYERGLRIALARYGPHHDVVATFRLNLAIVRVNLGEFERAREEHALAIAIWERIGGRNHPFVAVALNELAAAFNQDARPDLALPLLRRALAMRELMLGKEHRDTATTVAELAASHAALGHFATAHSLASRAVAIWEALEAPDAPEFANVLALYGNLESRREEYASARELYGRALEIRGRVFGIANPVYADAQVGLARALAGDSVPLAFENAVAAETKGRDHLRLLLRALPERQALSYSNVRPRGLDLMLSLAGQAQATTTQAFDGLVRGRALVLDEMATRRAAGGVTNDEAGKLRHHLAVAEQRLANLLVRGPAAGALEQHRRLVEAGRRAVDVAEQALADNSDGFREERARASIGGDEVSAALPSGAALVSFAHYRRSSFPASGGGRSAEGRKVRSDVPSYLAFVLRQGQPVAIVRLGTQRSIDAAVFRWRAEVASSPAIGDGAAGRLAGAALRDRIWDPLVQHLGETRHVFIVPDGALNLVPFDALPSGRRSYLVERGPILHYLAAERDLVDDRRPARAAAGLMALGGPTFGMRPAPHSAETSSGAPTSGTRRSARLPCLGRRTLRFTALPETRQEVREISAAWSVADRSVLTLLGRDASEAAFRREAPGRRVLHVATHGIFIGDGCEIGQATSRGVGGLAVTQPKQTLSKNNPLLLSGLALAGANMASRARNGEDDGILTAEEVAGLDLQGVEWAVLSACDTGLGRVASGEGVLGLRRAFQMAGARTVIMSLWSVDDASTRRWMVALYEARLKQGLSTAESVRHAMLSELAYRRNRNLSTHPFYWAAFVAAGDWR